MNDKKPATPTVPTTMDAVRLHAASDPARLVCERVETPKPGPGEVRPELARQKTLMPNG